jgi:hypothetical protein
VQAYGLSFITEHWPAILGGQLRIGNSTAKTWFSVRREYEMGASDEKALDEESHQPLLGEPEITIAAYLISTRERVTRLLLIAALLTNYYTWCYLSSYPYQGSELRQRVRKENWAQRAADVAESLATYDCSGHGNVYMDTLQTGAEVVCECHACFTGPTCAESAPDCDARIDSGDPVMYEAFWKQNGDIGTLVTPPWYRLSYAEGTSLDSYATPGLESQIRALHAMVGNAVTEDKSFVISAGSTQMLFAVAQAISVDYPGKTSVVGLTPFYEV